MFRLKVLFISLVFLGLCGQGQLMAQDGGGVFDDSLEDAIIVATGGAGGLILGLSTLSFVEHPSEHMKNLWVGAAIGVILGVGYVAYKAGSKTSEGYNGSLMAPSEDKKFATSSRYSWHVAQHVSYNTPSLASKWKMLSYNFTF